MIGDRADQRQRERPGAVGGVRRERADAHQAVDLLQRRGLRERDVAAGVAGLTGPVVRGDAGTVAAHLRELAQLAGRDESTVDVPATYRALARAATTRALLGGRIDDRQAHELLDTLAEPAPPEGT